MSGDRSTECDQLAMKCRSLSWGERFLVSKVSGRLGFLDDRGTMDFHAGRKRLLLGRSFSFDAALVRSGGQCDLQRSLR